MTCNALTAEELREMVRAVRDSILDLVARIDDIKLQQLPQIHAEYALKIGCWEQALLEAELAARRAKRKLALAQAQVNRGEEPHTETIESQLDQELAEWMKKVEEARLTYEQAIARRASTVPLKKADAKELRRVYRLLVKRLHPDVASGPNDDRAALFLLAQAAYRNGDVEMLNSLEVATRHLDGPDDLEATDDVSLLAQELELARIQKGVLLERLQELEEGEEMRLGRLLANREWVTARTTELRQQVEEWKRVSCEFEDRLKKLMEEHHGR